MNRLPLIADGAVAAMMVALLMDARTAGPVTVGAVAVLSLALMALNHRRLQGYYAKPGYSSPSSERMRSRMSSGIQAPPISISSSAPEISPQSRQ
jgi:hypothetical protein